MFRLTVSSLALLLSAICARWLAPCADAADLFVKDVLFIERIDPPCLQLGKTTRITIVGAGVHDANRLWTSLSEDADSSLVVGSATPGSKLIDVVLPPRATKSRTGRRFQKKQSKIQFDIKVSKNVQPGLYGLRVATPSGLSNVHLFAVEDLPIVSESEGRYVSSTGRDLSNSNDKPGSAQAVRTPACITGIIRESDVDCFAIDVQAGERLSFESVANRLGKGVDPLITIIDGNGRRVKSIDNTVGLFYDNRFEHKFEKSGRYTVQIRDTRFHGARHWSYLLRIGRFPAARVAIPSTFRPGESTRIRFPELEAEEFVDLSRIRTTVSEWDSQANYYRRFFLGVQDEPKAGSSWLAVALSNLPNAVESEPNNDESNATSIQVPCNIHGQIQQRGDEDWYQFDLKRGDRLHFRSDTRDMGSPADLELAVFAPDGKELVRKDDDNFNDASFLFAAAKDGRYRLQVSEVVRKGGPAFVYRIEIARRQPKIDIVAETGRLAVPKENWQPLLMSLKRLDYNGAVSLELVDAPQGITIEPTDIPPGESTYSGRLKVSQDTPEGIHTIQILARGEDGPKRTGPVTIVQTLPLIDRMPEGRGPHGEPFELREDQRRLPPSVVDRLAVLVLPQSPFNFEVEPKLVTLPRYTEAKFEIKTLFASRVSHGASFEARGGTLEYNRLAEPTTESELPEATVDNPNVVGRFTSGVNTPLKKHRVTITGELNLPERTIHLTRTLELDIKVAFNPGIKASQLDVKVGESITFDLLANRLHPFEGAFAVDLSAANGLEIDKSQIDFARSQLSSKITLTVPESTKPGTYQISVTSSGKIARFSESNSSKIKVVVHAKK